MYFKVTCRCATCGHRWVYKTKNPDRADPPCPNLDCGVQGEPIGMDLTLNKAPAAIGGNVRNKAIDETAAIVMNDYGMTDMRSDVREGETAAPKLPSQQQTMADAYFGSGARGRSGMPIIGAPGITLGDIRGGSVARSVALARSGMLRDPVSEARSIGGTHAARVRPRVDIINRDA